MEDTQRIVKCGNLSLHSPGGFFKKRWHGKYLVLYDGSKSGIKRLELFDSEIKFKKQNPAKIIPLVDCIRVVTCQRQKSTYTFEVRTNDQFYLLAAQSFQDMNDWVNCLRLVAFGQNSSSSSSSTTANSSQLQQSNNFKLNNGNDKMNLSNTSTNFRGIDVLLDKRATNGSQQQQQQVNLSNGLSRISSTAEYARSLEQLQVSCQKQQTVASAIGGGAGSQGNIFNGSSESHNRHIIGSAHNKAQNVGASASISASASAPAQTTNSSTSGPLTASQAASAAAAALAKTRQRQPSLLGSCKPQPPQDSPFITNGNNNTANNSSSSFSSSAPNQTTSGSVSTVLAAIGQVDTMTPTVRGQLISVASGTSNPLKSLVSNNQQQDIQSRQQTTMKKPTTIQAATLDEEEENMLYCSIEDNPAEHNYRVKVIETELSLRCQLKCYQLTAPTTISQQYEQLGQFNAKTGAYERNNLDQHPVHVTFYQLIIGPQELTLLNDYAAFAGRQQQGLWSWPYQCIRRYGFDKDNCFMFEAGRKCSSGPGQFIVQTPKAYTIYQDVVKFVTELRSLNTNSIQPINSMIQPPTQTNTTSTTTTTSSEPQKTITQIPVTWAPNTTNQNGLPETRAIATAPSIDNVVGEGDSDTRQQFFNTLRQLESSSSTGQSTTTKVDQLIESNSSVSTDGHDFRTSPDSPTSSTSISSSSLSTSASSNTDQRQQQDNRIKVTDQQQIVSEQSANKVNRKCGQTTDETDESGYEQGDDISSSSSRFKLDTNGVSRKRQAFESISSSASSSSGDGSPGHSVSRRSNLNNSNMINNQTNGKSYSHQALAHNRPALNVVSRVSNNNNQNAKAPIESNRQLLGLHNLMADSVLGPESFETNLIRDVYSEITKLHAKFAVTSTGSAEDSMSGSESSNEGSDNSDNQRERIEEPCEPMYSNVSASPESVDNNRFSLSAYEEVRYDQVIASRENGSNHRLSRGDRDSDPFDDVPMRAKIQSYIPSQRQQPHSNSYNLEKGQSRDQYLPPIRSGPIYPTILNPIPECGELTTQTPAHRQRQRQLSDIEERNFNGSKAINNNRQQTNNNRQNGDKVTRQQSQQQPRQMTGVTKSKLPTKHYVINDVQYAKISRNMHPKFDSCI